MKFNIWMRKTYFFVFPSFSQLIFFHSHLVLKIWQKKQQLWKNYNNNNNNEFKEMKKIKIKNNSPKIIVENYEVLYSTPSRSSFRP